MKKIIKIGLWKQPIFFVWNSTPEEYIQVLKDFGETSEPLSYCTGQTCMIDGVIVLYVKKQKKEKMLLTLHHEILHAVNLCLKARGIKFDDEVYAYTIEHLQKKCYKSIKLKIDF